MLVLSRKEGEGITLILDDGQNIEIVLAGYAGQITKVSIKAPEEVKIFRNGLWIEDK